MQVEAVYRGWINAKRAYEARVLADRRYGMNLRWCQTIAPGSYYSALPDMQPLADDPRVYEQALIPLYGIDMNETVQQAMYDELKVLMADNKISWAAQPTPSTRFFTKENHFYGIFDANVLRLMVARHRPRRYVEVGSGLSTCALLDIREAYGLGFTIDCVEPYPYRLHESLRKDDWQVIKLHEMGLQQAPLEIFTRLQENDILFIDSSHVLKFGSDLSRIFYEILPLLNPGVVIHFHDIFYPFEYPKPWLVDDHRAWSEDYGLRLFLTNNKDYQILLWPSWVVNCRPQWHTPHFPTVGHMNTISFWMKKVGPRCSAEPIVRG